MMLIKFRRTLSTLAVTVVDERDRVQMDMTV